MKRYFSLIFCLIGIFILSGCVNNTVVIELLSFDSTVKIIRDDFIIKGSFKFVHPDEMILIITDPIEIQGVTVCYQNGKTTLSNENLTVDIDSISSGNDVFTPLFEALNVIATSNIQVEKTGINEVDLPSYGIIFTFSSDEMKILSLKNYSVTYKFN